MQEVVPVEVREALARAAALADRCGAAARVVDCHDLRAVALLTAQVDALDAALRPALRWSDLPAALPSLIDAVCDHRVTLSAAGLPPEERRRAVRSLADLLHEAAGQLRAGTAVGSRTGRGPARTETQDTAAPAS